MNIKKYNIAGQEKGEESLALPEAKEMDEKKSACLYYVLKYQRARARQGTAHTKTRSEVRGGGAKPYRQKGTGRARRGTNRSPLKVGGGITFGPRTRDYTTKLNKAFVKKTMQYAFLLRAGKVFLLDNVEEKQYSTKDIKGLLSKLSADVPKRPMFILDDIDSGFARACRNLKGSIILTPVSLDLGCLLTATQVLLTSNALRKLEKGWAIK